MLNSLVYYFYPISELIAFKPMSRPFFNRSVEGNAFVTKFPMFPKRLPSFCVLSFLCHLGPIYRALFMVTFLGRFFLLTLSYLTTKDCPFGNVTRCGITRRLNNILSARISPLSSSPFTTKHFFNNWVHYCT